ncbi:MAG: SGNH/GDSL hydrolase family protein [Clostridia bacterium]|nr:SGNH/GDSL hydrolase family protein [Clostridia bacterium]
MKKLLSVLLSIVLAFSCMSIIAFAEEEPIDYVVLGDSIAFGAGMVNTVDACYGKIVAETNGYNYVNHSIPGITSGVLLTMVSDGEKIRASIEEAEIISISIGGNNYLTNNIVGLAFDCLVKKDMTNFDQIAEVFYSEFCAIMDKINEINPDAVVLMQTLYNPQDAAAGIVYAEGGNKLNEMIRKYDTEHPGEIVIVEVGEALNSDRNNFADDKIHPSAAGNEIIAREVLGVLYELGLGENTEPVINTKGLDLIMPISYALLVDIVCKLFQMLGNLVNP